MISKLLEEVVELTLSRRRSGGRVSTGSWKAKVLFRGGRATKGVGGRGGKAARALGDGSVDLGGEDTVLLPRHWWARDVLGATEGSV